MRPIRATLYQLRQHRLAEVAQAEKASEYLHRATQGTGIKHALSISGTGHCPLTDNASRYTAARQAAIRAKRQADALWQPIAKRLATLDLDPRSVIELYYNLAMPWEDIPAAIKRSPKACERLHREAIAYLEREQP